MSMNYLDYTDDRAMFLFSPNQVDEMEEYLSLYLPDLLELNVFINDSIFIEPQDTILTPVDSTFNPIDTNTIDTILIPTDTSISPIDTIIQTPNPTNTVTNHFSRNIWIYLGVFASIGLFIWLAFIKKD